MKTPTDILEKFEKASLGLDYGSVSLILTVKQGQPRYVIAREESFLPEDDTPPDKEEEEMSQGDLIKLILGESKEKVCEKT